MIKEKLKVFISGFLMGSADVVPGVSGGTIALVVGIYERLVGNIRQGSSALGSLLKGNWTGFKRHFQAVEWPFLLTLLLGIGVAVFTLASAIRGQLEERPIVLAAGFFGLVLGSVVVAVRLIREPKPTHYTVASVVAVFVFAVLGLGGGEASGDPSTLVYFASGALAICAMILPGISGSLILVLVGTYDAVLGAVADRDVGTIAVVGAGAVIGLALFSQLLHAALERAHDLVLAGLIGLMAGSLRILWPWPDGVDGPALEAPGDHLWLAVSAAVVGFLAVMLISRLASEREPDPVAASVGP